jgi:hypothetical protein
MPASGPMQLAGVGTVLAPASKAIAVGINAVNLLSPVILRRAHFAGQRIPTLIGHLACLLPAVFHNKNPHPVTNDLY